MILAEEYSAILDGRDYITQQDIDEVRNSTFFGLTLVTAPAWGSWLAAKAGEFRIGWQLMSNKLYGGWTVASTEVGLLATVIKQRTISALTAASVYYLINKPNVDHFGYQFFKGRGISFPGWPRNWYGLIG